MTIYSFCMAVLWCDLFVILGVVLSKWNRLIRCSIIPMTVLMGTSIFRLAFTFEVPETRIIRSNVAYPFVYELLNAERIPSSWVPFALNIANIFIFIWIIVGIFLLIRYVVSYSRGARFAKKLSVNRDFDSERILHRVADGSKSCVKVRVFRANEVRMPMVHGVFRPSIFLPRYEMSDLELEHILSHEWYHVRSWHILLKIIVNIICIIFWWNLPVYLLKRNLDHALEIKCDIDVIKNMSVERRLDYIETGIHVQRLCNMLKYKVAPNTAQFMSSSDKLIEQRFNVILDYRKPGLFGNAANYGFLSIVIALVVLSYSFVIQPYVGYFEGDVDPYSGEELFVTVSGMHLIQNEDGTYSFYANGTYVTTLQDISDPFYSSVPIVEDRQEENNEKD